MMFVKHPLLASRAVADEGRSVSGSMHVDSVDEDSVEIRLQDVQIVFESDPDPVDWGIDKSFDRCAIQVGFD